MAKIEAVVFDYYETLARLPDAAREPLFDDIAHRAGASLAPGEAYRQWRRDIDNDLKVRFGGVRPALDGPVEFVSFRETWIERFRQLFAFWGVDAAPGLGADASRDAPADAEIYPDARRGLEALRAGYRLAIFSNADNDFLSPSVERSDLGMETVISSEDVQAYKPHVSAFREVCRRLELAPEAVVYIGDSPRADIEGPLHAGMRAVWINRCGVEPGEPTTTLAGIVDGLPGVRFEGLLGDEVHVYGLGDERIPETLDAMEKLQDSVSAVEDARLPVK